MFTVHLLSATTDWSIRNVSIIRSRHSHCLNKSTTVQCDLIRWWSVNVSRPRQLRLIHWRSRWSMPSCVPPCCRRSRVWSTLRVVFRRVRRQRSLRRLPSRLDLRNTAVNTSLSRSVLSAWIDLGPYRQDSVGWFEFVGCFDFVGGVKRWTFVLYKRGARLVAQAPGRQSVHCYMPADC